MLSMADTKKDNIYKLLFWLLLLAGTCLRMYQHFFLGRPLWEDEAHLALNFIDSGYIGMFMPLKHAQSAPILFILSVETVTKIFGFSEIALRSVPFFVSLLIYPLFYPFVRDMTGNKPLAILAFAMLTFSSCVIHYSSELKPYTVELSSYIGLGYLLFSKSNYVSTRRNKLLIIWGIIAMFSANMSLIMLVCIAAYRIYKLKRQKQKDDKEAYQLQKKKNKKLFKTWAIAFVCSIILNIILNPIADNMREMWKFAFIPQHIFSHRFIEFMSVTLNQLFFESMFLFWDSIYSAYILAFILLMGLGYMIYNKKYIWLMMTVLPVCIHLGFSWAQLYPLSYKFILYLMPAVYTWISISTLAVVQFLSRKLHFIMAIPYVVFILFFCIYPSSQKFPFNDRNIKPCLDYINNQPHDMKLFTTTPKTLYEYYYLTGYAHNPTREEVKWFITPGQYYDSVSKQHDNYMLLQSASGGDGYQPIYKDLKKRGLILDEFVYSDFRVLKIKPKPENSSTIALP